MREREREKRKQMKDETWKKKREINSFFFPVGRISAARGGNGNDRNVDDDERK